MGKRIAQAIETGNDNSRVCFLHSVGKSTVRQGLTVPVSVQTPWLKEIGKGEAIRVVICFGESQSAEATLRRINNSVGHLQFRYEGRNQSALREYLRSEFAEDNEGGVSPLEVTEVGHRRFLFRPIPGDHVSPPALTIYRPLFHGMSAAEARDIEEFAELAGALSGVFYLPEDGQREYNCRIAASLLEHGWRKEARVLKEIGLRVDFERNGTWLEVEFGNARGYYQDYVKFALAARYQSATCGILLCPTEPFAHLLCQLGQKRAATKRNGVGSKAPIYSGMMTYEKAARELPYLSFVLSGRIIVAGIHLSRPKILP